MLLWESTRIKLKVIAELVENGDLKGDSALSVV